MAAPTAPRGPVGIVTPEAVVLEFAEAGLGSRSLGFLADLVVRVLALYVLFLGASVGGLVLDDTVLVVIMAAAGFAVLFVYPVACETLLSGRTPGKMLLGLRVVTTEGAPVRFRHAAIRAALGIVDFLVGAGCVAIISALASERSQRLGDLAAGTIVIRDRQAVQTSRSIAFRPLPGWEPFTDALDVSALSDEGYVLVRAFLLRSADLRPPARRERAEHLVAAVARIIDVQLPPGTDPEGFLVAVAAAYQRRAARTAPGAVPSSAPSPAAGWEEDQPAATWGAAPGSS